jgi:hypothetical protein
MVETTLDIRFQSGDEACVIVDSNAPDAIAEQAELVSFGHYSARIIGRLGPGGALPLVHLLTSLEEASMDYLLSLVESEGPRLDDVDEKRIRVLPPESMSPSDQAFVVRARFLDPWRGPRISFAVKAKGLPPPGRGDGYHASASVHVLLYALLKRRAADRSYLRRLAGTAGLVGRLAVKNEIRPDNEFDVSLAAADVAWRRGLDVDESRGTGAPLRCPVCGNEGSTAQDSGSFDSMLWPSDRADLCRCNRCGAGLWLRAGRRPRRIARDSWRAMELMRSELTGVSNVVAGGPTRAEQRVESGLLEDLKLAFAQNGWPFSEVLGADALVSELSGPLGTWKFYAQIVPEQELLLMYSVCPLQVPAERRPEVSHFLTRANYGLSAATFELDFDDGEVRCKTVLHLDGGEIDATALKRFVRTNGLAMETYLPGIGAVITGTPALPALERRTTS